MLYLTKLSFKHEEEITKIPTSTEAEEIYYYQSFPERNAQGNSAGWSERALDSHSKPYEEMTISVNKIKQVIK